MERNALCIVFYHNQPAQRIWKVMVQQNGKAKKPVLLDSNAKLADSSAALSLPPPDPTPNVHRPFFKGSEK